ncbi:unnamed protein product [Ectocarpus sp. CCAP 1310/34]|nr:unnamed protein product [Ectocarpus sp. CCAP 1310/34]
MVNSKSKFVSMSPEAVRGAILLTLVVQNSAQAIFMRYSFKPKSQVEGEDKEAEPASSTAVMMAELCKLACSILLQYRDDGSVRHVVKTLREDVWERPVELVKMAVPACLYVVQNNLNYVAISNLDGPTFQLLYQLKILTTALFSVLMLKRVLHMKQWGALAMLAVGVGLVQVSSSSSQSSGDSEDDGVGIDDAEGDEDGSGQNPLLGLVMVLLACCTSGFAGVYFEKVLKGTSVSLWVRNMQLSGFGILLGAGCVWFKDGQAVSENGFFYGYNYAVWMAILLNSMGGLVVAMVVKYADNVIKGFATSVSIVLTALISFVLFDFRISVMFVIGAYFVLHSTFLYSQKPPNASNSSSNSSSSSADGGAAAKGANGSGEGDVEIAEKEVLLRGGGGQGHVSSSSLSSIESPRNGRPSGPLARKSNSKLAEPV